MGLVARAFQRRSIENPATKMTDPAQWFIDWAGGGPSAAGVPVTAESAVTFTAVWCAVRILSETLGSLPLFLYERSEPGGRRRVTDDPRHTLVHDEPNPDQSAFFFRETMQGALVLRGNAYAAIRRDGGGRPRELRILHPERVRPHRTREGELRYAVRLDDGTEEAWEKENLLHVPGFSFDGVLGKSAVAAFRDAIGLGLAAQQYGAKLFSRGGRVPGVLEYSLGKLGPEQRKNVAESWNQTVGGTENWHQVAILDRGLTYKKIGIDPDDGQFLQTRKFQVTEVARMFRVTPHLLYDLERATFSNIEQQAIEFVVHTMRPHVVRWEQELNRKLLSPEERRRLYFAFNLDGLLRGDTQARGQFYALGRQWGFLTTNDILTMEDRPTIGEEGDVYLAPMNMVPVQQLGELPPVRSRPALPAARDRRSLAGRRRLRNAHRPLFEDLGRRLITREVRAVEGAVKRLLEGSRAVRDRQQLRRWLDEFYGDQEAFAARNALPLLRSYAEVIVAAAAEEIGSDPPETLSPELERFVEGYAKAFGIRESSESKMQLLALLEASAEEQAAESIRGRVSEWMEKRPEKLATRESVQSMSAVAKAFFVGAGVGLLRWRANPGACAFCQKLDGAVVEVTGTFVAADGAVDAGQGEPLRPGSDVGHPPLHGGCSCDISAG